MLVVTTNRRPCGRTKTTGGMETDRLPGLPTPCSPPAPLRPIGAGRPWGEVTSTTSVQVSWPCVDGLRSKGDSEAAAGPCHPKVNAPAPPRLSTAALPKTTSCTLRHTLDPSARWGVRLRTEFPGKRARGPKQSRNPTICSVGSAGRGRSTQKRPCLYRSCLVRLFSLLAGPFFRRLLGRWSSTTGASPPRNGCEIPV